MIEALEADCAIIVFPAGEVSLQAQWAYAMGAGRRDFYISARKTGASILPVHIEARNSALFYSLSMIYKPLSTLWLAREMFNKKIIQILNFVGRDPLPAKGV